MNEIRKKQYEMEILADLLESLHRNMDWYRHADENGTMVDDTDENSALHLSAYRSVEKAILKVAGV